MARGFFYQASKARLKRIVPHNPFRGVALSDFYTPRRILAVDHGHPTPSIEGKKPHQRQYPKIDCELYEHINTSTFRLAHASRMGYDPAIVNPGSHPSAPSRCAIKIGDYP